VRRLLLTVLALTLVGLAGSDRALAHGEDGVLEVVNAVPTPAGDVVAYTVELTYANDGDLVEGAVVTATARRPGSGAEAPVTLPSIGDGWYAANVTFPGPGRWTVTFTATDPAATVDAEFEVVDTPVTTTTTAPTGTGAPPTTAGPELVADEEDVGDDGPPAGLVLGAVVAGAALVAAIAVLVLRRRSLED
jgi:hypothetical protein